MKTRLTNRYVIAIIILQFFGVTAITSGCKTWSKTAKGGAIGAGSGAVAGAAVGAVAGGSVKSTILGAIIGAAVGGTTGAVIGHYMDKQAAEIQQDVKGAKIERVGEGIRITFDSGILFDIGSYQLKDVAKNNITELSKVLKKYEDTNILIEGHTDNTGSDELNMKLSEQRANSVANFAKTLGILGTRMAIQGYGEAQPIEDNKSEIGRSKNRRVEVAIMANDKLKKAAKRGDI
jgi:outer membrane protein OmpA-like peptidoglycan-associated protein